LRGQSKKKINKAGWLLFYLYIILLSYFLFVSERYGLKEYRWNLHLFKEIHRFVQYREQIGLKGFVLNILGNVLAFAPFGFLLPLLGKRYRNFFYTVFLCFLFSLTAETIQLFLKIGIFDVDDIFMNTMGGILGYIAYALIHVFTWAFKPSKKKSRRK
jgi:Glycopeptide antibiotics resistance protein